MYMYIATVSYFDSKFNWERFSFSCMKPSRLMASDLSPVSPPLCSLGVEPVDEDVMTRPPRKASDRMLTLPLLAQVFGAAFAIVAGTLWVFKKEVSAKRGFSSFWSTTLHSHS